MKHISNGPIFLSLVFRYQAQVTLLSTLLRPVHGQLLEIGTVDGMQGREKEAVAISLVRSNDKVGLPTEPKSQRFNASTLFSREK